MTKNYALNKTIFAISVLALSFLVALLGNLAANEFWAMIMTALT